MNKQDPLHVATSGVSRRQFGAGAVGMTLAGVMSVTGRPVFAESATGISGLYDSADAMQLAELVHRRQVSASELLEEAIRRVELLNPRLNAVTLQHFDLARQYLKNNKLKGPLAGVPFLLKDLGVQLAGTPTTGGSRSLVGINAQADSELVKRYKKAGLVIFGKTNVPEFGMALTTESLAYGPCHNPWNLQHSTGGSSGGSAAAVAAGIVPLAHGTDGGGSIRVPASACGVFGFKPTRVLTPGRTSASAMSIGHVLSRTVRDSAFALDLTAGYEAGTPFAAPGNMGGYFAATRQAGARLRIALNLSEPEVALDPEVKKAVERSAKLLESAGHHVEEAVPGINYQELNAAQETLMLSEFSNGMDQLGKMLGKDMQVPLLEPLSVLFMEVGRNISARQFLQAWGTAQQAGSRMAKFQQGYDIVIQPVTATPPPRLGVINEQPNDDNRTFVDRFRRYSAFTHLYNMTGQPSASIPTGLSSKGLPLATMLSARNGEDALLFNICAELERLNPWFNIRPDLV